MSDITPIAAKASVARTPKPPDRIIPLSLDRISDFMPCAGIPDVHGTRLLCAGLILVFGGMLIMILVALAVDKTVRLGAIGPLLILLLLAAFGWLLWILIDAYRNIGGWFYVDEQGFRYGVGSQRGDDRAAVETRIDWQDILCNPERRYDVTTEFVSRQALVKELRFWRRLPSGEHAEHRLPLRLSTNDFRCWRFRNRAEVLRAVVSGLAKRPELRFDAHVFVDVCIDPQTWQPMRAPRVSENVGGALACAAMMAVIWSFVWFWPGWLTTIAALGAMGLVCWISANRWGRKYPQLEGSISFRAETRPPSGSTSG